MKLLDISQEPKLPKPYQPVAVVFETKDELELITKLIGMTSNYDAKRILNFQSEQHDCPDVYPLFELLQKKCIEYGVNMKCGSLTYKDMK